MAEVQDFKEKGKFRAVELLKVQVDKYLLELAGYCLMGNHIYIVAIPHEQDSQVKGIGRTHFR